MKGGVLEKAIETRSTALEACITIHDLSDTTPSAEEAQSLQAFIDFGHITIQSLATYITSADTKHGPPGSAALRALRKRKAAVIRLGIDAKLPSACGTASTR